MIVLVDRHRGHVDHPQPRLAQEQQQEEEALLQRLVHRARGRPEPVERHRRHDDDRLARVALAHESPHLGQLRLQDVEELAPRRPRRGRRAQSAPVDVRRRGHVHGSSSCSTVPMTSWTSRGREMPRSSIGPSERVSKRSSRPARTRGLMRIWPARGGGAQPRGEVGDGPDRGVVPPALEADPAERRVALGDADAEAEVVALPAPARRRARRRGRASATRHPHRPLGRVRARRRVVEEDHQPVAGEVLERPLVARRRARRARRGTRGAPPSSPPAPTSRRTR